MAVYVKQNGTWVQSEGGTGLPEGGTPGQVLAISGDGTTYEWIDPPTPSTIPITSSSHNDLLAMYDLNTASITGGTLMTDVSGNGNNLTIFGTSQAVGLLGQATVFDGSTSDHLQGTIPVTGNITFSVWVNAAVTGAPRYIISQESSVGSYGGRGLFVTAAGHAAFFSRDNGSNWKEVISLNPITEGWHHVVGIQNGSEITLYVDGAFQGSLNMGSAEICGTLLAVGSVPYSSTQNLEGSLDQIRIFGTDVQASDVVDLHQEGGIAEVTNDILDPNYINTDAYYTLNDNDMSGATDVLDISSNRVHALRTGTTSTPGVIDEGRLFNGTSDIITLPSAVNVSRTEYTISAWVKPGSGTVLVYQDRSCVIRINNPAQRCLFWNSKTGTGSFTYHELLAGLPEGVWSHLAIVFSGSPTFYINGKQSPTATQSGVSSTDFDYTMLGGYRTSSTTYYGDQSLDHVRVYKEALLISQINELVDEHTFAITDMHHPRLLSSHTMSSYNGSTVFDERGVYDATVTGSPTQKPGWFGDSLLFDGTNDGMTIPLNLSDGEVYTVSAWIDGTDQQQNISPFTLYVDGSNYGELIRLNADSTYNSVRYGAMYKSSTWYNGGLVADAFDCSKLNHFVVTITTNQMQFYINGVLTHTETNINATPNSLGNSELRIGFRDGSTKYRMSADQLRVYNVILQQADVTELFNETKTTYAITDDGHPGLFFSHSLNEVDLSGNNHGDGSYNGRIGVQNANVTATPSVGSIGGTARSFANGKITSTSDKPRGDYAVSFWFKCDPTMSDGNTVGTILNDRNTTDSETSVVIMYDDRTSTSSSNSIRIFCGSGAGAFSLRADNVIDPNAWHHICFVMDGTSMLLYIDGAEKDSGTFSGNRQYNNISYEWMNGYGSSSAYPTTGSLDRIRFFKQALTISDVNNLAQEGKTPYVRNDNAYLVGAFLGIRDDLTADDFDRNRSTNGVQAGSADAGILSSGPPLTALLNNTQTVPQLSGSSLDLSAAYAYMGGNNVEFDFGTGDFTVSLWARPANGNAAAAPEAIVSKFNGNSNSATDFNGWYLYREPSTNQLSFRTANVVGGSGHDITLQTSFVLDNASWHHIVIARLNNDLYMYVDNELSQTFNYADTIDVSATTEVRFGNVDISAVSDYTGFVQNIRFFKGHGATPAEVTELYNENRPEIARTDIADIMYTMDRFNGAQMYDESPNDTNATINMPTVPGKIGNALALDGVTSYTSTNVNWSAAEDEMTVSMWVKTTNDGSQTSILIAEPDNTTNRFNIHLPWSTNDIMWDFGHLGSGATGQRLTSTWNVAWNSTWTHFMFTSGQTEKNFYVNGQLVETAAIDVAPAVDMSSMEIRMGRYAATGEYKAADIDMVRIYRSEKTALDAETLHNAGAGA